MAQHVHHRYVIGLGSNLDDRMALIGAAHQLIEKKVGVIEANAPMFATAPMGAADQPVLNTAIRIATDLPPIPLLHALLGIETELGRVRRERWGNRRIDCDILLWEELGVTRSHEDTDLVVPHPALLERDFALVPAAAVAGDWLHPMTGRSLTEELRARGYRLAALS